MKSIQRSKNINRTSTLNPNSFEFKSNISSRKNYRIQIMCWSVEFYKVVNAGLCELKYVIGSNKSVAVAAIEIWWAFAGVFIINIFIDFVI